MDYFLQKLLANLIRPFIELAKAPRALWYIIGVYFIDCIAYFGMLTLMTIYLSHDLRWGDEYAGLGVSIYTMLITLAMLGIGSFAESFGLRRAMLAGLAVAAFGRALYCLAPDAAGFWQSVGMMIVSLLIISCGSGLLQPICYSGVKQYTDEKTSSMGYAAIYAFANLGMIVAGALSAWIRPEVQKMLDHPFSVDHANGFFEWMAQFSGSGVRAVNWLFCAVTAVGIVLVFLIFTKRQESTRLRSETPDAELNLPKPAWRERLKGYFTDGPFSNVRFVFFIFMTLPVRTIFAHQWLTMPEYIIRAYPKGVGDKMEWLVEWINPGIIFIAVPLLTTLTRRINVYTLMIVGSLVSALPTFLLCMGPDLKMLLLYFFIFSIGEALWFPRYLEYSSELAPPGRVAQYMGLANIPWLLAKGTTGLYSGMMLARFCPPKSSHEPQHTGILWLIYGSIAMTTPLGLWLARKWVMAGLHSPKVE